MSESRLNTYETHDKRWLIIKNIDTGEHTHALFTCEDTCCVIKSCVHDKMQQPHIESSARIYFDSESERARWASMGVGWRMCKVSRKLFRMFYWTNDTKNKMKTRERKDREKIKPIKKKVNRSEGNSMKIHNSFRKFMITIHYFPHSSPIFASYKLKR